MILKRFYHACNSFIDENGLTLVVVGGTVTSSQTGANANEFLVYNPENDSDDASWDNLGGTLDLPHTQNGYLPYSFEYNVRIVFFFSPKNCEY